MWHKVTGNLPDWNAVWIYLHCPFCQSCRWCARQIRTVKNVLNATFAQCSGRLDDASLQTLVYEAMVTVNSCPLTVDGINDPHALEPLTLNLSWWKLRWPFPPWRIREGRCICCKEMEESPVSNWTVLGSLEKGVFAQHIDKTKMALTST